MTDYPFRCLLAAVVSTKAQAKKSDDGDDKLSLDNQLATGREHVARHPAWRIVDEIKVPGQSRSDYVFLYDLCKDSPEYKQIVDTVQADACDLVIVSVADRLFHTVEVQQQLMAVFRAHRVQLYDCMRPKEPVPPDKLKKATATDKLLDFVSLGYPAELDIELRNAKTLPGRYARITEKRLPILGHAPYGYRHIDTKHPPEQVPAEIQWLRWIREQRLQRLGWGRIAAELAALGVRDRQGKPWSRGALRYMMCNEFYAGRISWGPASAIGAHEPVFSAAEWAELQEVNRLLADDHSPRHVVHEFSGLCRCDVCGRAMRYRGDKALCCNAYCDDDDRRRYPRHQNYWPEPRLRAWLIARLQAELGDVEKFVAARTRDLGEQQRTLEAIDAEIKQRRGQLTRWDDAYEAGAIDVVELGKRRTRIAEAIGRLQEERDRAADLATARQAIETQAGALAESQDALNKLLAALPDLDWQQRRAIYLRLIRRIWLAPGQDPRIEWRGAL